MGRGMFHSQVDKTGWRPKYTLKEMAPVTSAVCPEEERAGWSVWESSRAGLRKRKATQCLWPRMAELRSTRRVWRRQISGCLKEELPDHDSWQPSSGLPGFPVLGPWRHLQWGGCRGISYVLEGERPGDSGGSWWQVMPQWPPYVPVWERICPETLNQDARRELARCAEDGIQACLPSALPVFSSAVSLCLPIYAPSPCSSWPLSRC